MILHMQQGEHCYIVQAGHRRGGGEHWEDFAREMTLSAAVERHKRLVLNFPADPWRVVRAVRTDEVVMTTDDLLFTERAPRA